MGLDQYLSARRYIEKYELIVGLDRIVSTDFKLACQFGPAGLTKNSDYAGASVELPLAYWRKANAIHGWFVREIQGGVDDCGDYYCDRHKLVDLRDACIAVLNTTEENMEEVAREVGLLPTSGFFFGSTEIDEWYVKDLEYTVETLNHALDLIKEDDWKWSFSYHSSW